MEAVLTPSLLAFLEASDVGVLGVTRRDGSPHLSVVYHLVRDGKVYVSTEPTRLKGRAVARTGRASLAVLGRERPYPAFTIEGPAVLRQDEGVGVLTTALFGKVAGTPLDAPLDDAAVRAMNRAVIEITPERVYAVSHLEA